ncbi:MAG: GtrA family protein [Candidatus Solibacter usitatus]|nr:GtrA family protein [Candidatus Solibacter usitatus]
MRLGARWLKFNAVGLAGVGVQLAALALFAKVLHWNYLAATAPAVETAVLHNYAWHAAWTWRDRPAAGEAPWLRLLRFHLGNGLVSIVSNVLLMRLLAGALGWPLMLSNGVSIILTPVLNFLASEYWVFSRDAGK